MTRALIDGAGQQALHDATGRYLIIPGPIIPGMPFIIGTHEAAIVVHMKIQGSTTRIASTRSAISVAFAQVGHGS